MVEQRPGDQEERHDLLAFDEVGGDRCMGLKDPMSRVRDRLDHFFVGLSATGPPGKLHVFDIIGR